MVVRCGLPELQIPGWTSEVRPNKIRILNPTRHGACWTGRNRVERYVRTGRAVIVGLAATRFIESDARNIAAAMKAAEAGAGYVVIRRTLTVDELAHIPFVNPHKALWR